MANMLLKRTVPVGCLRNPLINKLFNKGQVQLHKEWILTAKIGEESADEVE